MTISDISHGWLPSTIVEDYITHDEAMLLLGRTLAYDSGIGLLQRWLSENHELAPYLRFQVNTSFEPLINTFSRPYTLTIEALTPFLLPEDSPLTILPPHLSAAASHVITLAFSMPDGDIASLDRPITGDNLPSNIPPDVDKLCHLADPPHAWLMEINADGDTCYVQYGTRCSTITFTVDLSLLRLNLR